MTSRSLSLLTWAPVVAALALASARADDAPPMVAISPVLTQSALELPAGIHDALRTRDWTTAAAGLQKIDPSHLVGGQKGDLAFLVTWSLVHADRGAAAVPYLDLIDGADSVPAPWAALAKAEVLSKVGRGLDALPLLEAIPADSGAWPRATVVRAEILRGLDRTKDAFDLYDAMLARPDPAPGSATALLARAQRVGLGSDAAYADLRRLWSWYPRADEASDATRLLAANYPGRAATWQETGSRAEQLMNAGDYASAISLTDAMALEVKGEDMDACRFQLVHGRSLYKAAKLALAATALEGIGERCKVVDADYGPKGLFVQGQALYRKHDYAGSAATNLKIAALYPNSSFADDGLTQAGYAYEQAGDLDHAAAAWLQALDLFPAGDTVPEASLRLAFADYLEGKPDDARTIAEKLGKLPIDGDALHVAAGRYWAARWDLYPDVNDPSHAVDDPVRKKAAIDGWVSLCHDQPHSFYSILAYARLVEVAPDEAKAVAARPDGFDHGDSDVPWVVRLDFYDNPAVREGVDLARLGLIREAMTEWDPLDDDAFTGDEEAWITQLRGLDGDWLLAHDAMRAWIARGHPAGTLGPRQAQVLRVAYPDRYWTEVKANASGYDFEPRLFHALIREESNFNKSIQSNVGARGLSQLMPTTAREVAGWMHVPYVAANLDDPAYNVKLGSRYFESVYKQHHGSPYLACAAYNAGAGRVQEWLTAWGNVPTDEFVERIPFRETRGYVKRVMGTWQTERWQFDDGPLFYDLSKFNAHALPD